MEYWLDYKKVSLLILFFVIAFLLYLGTDYLKEPDNPVLFIIALVLVPLYFMIAIIYSFIYILKKRRENGQ